MPIFRSNNPFKTSNTAIQQPLPPPRVTIPPPTPNRDPELDALGLNEDAPPAYTPAPDLQQGESSLELGPRRPFQRAPQPPVQQQLLSPNPVHANRSALHGRTYSQSRPQEHQSFWQQLTGTTTNYEPPPRPSSTGSPGPSADWTVFPGHHSSSTHNTSSRAPPLPPRHPSSNSLGSSPVHTRARSEFARDFYTAGPIPANSSNPAGLPPPGSTPDRAVLSSSSSLPSSTANNSVQTTSDFALDFYAADPAFLQHSQSNYAPPPGPPPSTSGAENDGKPTRTPISGHPLLKDDKTLIYPAGYVCDKCENTGYKNQDPTHPCRKCWTKYSKPYAGALLYTPWPASTSGSSATPAANGAKTTLQRPLTRLPVAAPSQTVSAPVNPPRVLRRSASSTQPFRAPQRQQPQPQPRIEFTDGYSNRPPPGALVVPPGDPRLGGRLCYKCGGEGVMPFFLFDETSCFVCGGAGRVYE